MKAYKNILKSHGLTKEEVKNVEREIRLTTFANLFNNHMKLKDSFPFDDLPQMMLTLIDKEFDDKREEAEWTDENLFSCVDDFDNAVECLRGEIDAERVKKAINLLETNNIELVDVDEDLSDIIHDLMEEYGVENDLPEGWWESEATTEDIVKMLG